MEKREHIIQDACEILAVARMRRAASELGVACDQSVDVLMSNFKIHLDRGGVSSHDLDEFSQYLDNVDKFIPIFIERIVSTNNPQRLRFDLVEREFRNKSMKGDFELSIDERNYSVSLKNYRNSIARPQVSAGTFNSFALSFVLEATEGPGMFLDPRSGKPFKGSTKTKRDSALEYSGMKEVVPLFAELDRLNDEIKQTFIYSEEFEFLDETKFDLARKRVGLKGAKLTEELLSTLELGRVRSEIIKRIGFDGTEEQLLFDPTRYADSLTVPKFGELINQVRTAASFSFQVVGQSLNFSFSDAGRNLLKIQVPFTINKNGAWISELYEGARFHKKEGVALLSGQRRPRKSRQLATSVNTYVDLESTGIFLRDEI